MPQVVEQADREPQGWVCGCQGVWSLAGKRCATEHHEHESTEQRHLILGPSPEDHGRDRSEHEHGEDRDRDGVGGIELGREAEVLEGS